MKKKRKNKKIIKSFQPKHPTLSLCMIVKDEEKYLGRCLESAKDIVDEIVVVDTGSKDKTIEIAEKYHAKVVHYQWNDDFAAARNESLKHASAQWILVLDADEEPDEANKKKLMRIVRANKGIAFFLNLRSPIPDNGAGVAFVNAFPRLFKNHLGICFEDRIHEQIISSVNKLGGSIEMTDIIVHHHGYSAEKENKQAKMERNLRLLQMQVSEDPDSALAHFHLAEACSLSKKTEGAIPAYKRAIELGNIPYYILAIAHQNLANAYIKKKQFVPAAEECNKALEIQPTLITPYFLMAYAAYRNGQWDKAIRQFQVYLQKARRNEKRSDRFAEHEPNYSAVYTFLGHCYMNSGNLSRAEESYKQAIAKGSKYAETYRELTRIFLKNGRIDKAINTLEKALQQDIRNPLLHRTLAKAYIKQNRLSDAKKIYEQIITKPEVTSEDYLMLASIYDTLGEPKKPIEMCEQAITLDSTNAKAHFLLGNIFLRQNKLNEAEQSFLKARKYSPQTPEVFYNLAVIDIKRKNYQRAISYFTELLKIDPTNMKASRKLNALQLKMKNSKTPQE